MPARRSAIFLLGAVLLPTVAGAWSDAAAELARRAEAEFGDRLVVVPDAAAAQARGLPMETVAELSAAQREFSARSAFHGAVLPFRLHWFDSVRCVILIPARPDDADAEWWAMAHEIGHCVARLSGWQASLWRDPSVVVRHRAESWADAFAMRLSPRADRERRARIVSTRRALLGDDAAYLTQRAIRCMLPQPDAAGEMLVDSGRAVERLLAQPQCLEGAARLRATEDFLASLGARSAGPTSP
jgi:hypothetical protein